MRILAPGLLSIFTFLCGCAADGESTTEPPLVPGAPIPTTSGSFASRYEVPVPSELATAADFAVDHAEWTVSGSTVTLHYDLPVGLVGGKAEVTLSGTLAAGATTVALAGEVGTGTCVADATHLVCREELAGLGAMPISTTVVEQTAASEYAGPAADRVRVANLFASDPIGFVRLDLSAPVVDDSGDDSSDR
ncbi:MAG: hypothetical protein ABI867_12305 [Kofleriaceae bacterium]